MGSYKPCGMVELAFVKMALYGMYGTFGIWCCIFIVSFLLLKYILQKQIKILKIKSEIQSVNLNKSL